MTTMGVLFVQRRTSTQSKRAADRQQSCSFCSQMQESFPFAWRVSARSVGFKSWM